MHRPSCRIQPEKKIDLSCSFERRPQWALRDDAGAEPSGSSGAGALVATFACPDGISIEAVFDNATDTVTVTLPDDTVTLPRVESASGARYSDGTTTFWNHGDEVLVEVDGKTVYESCVAEN